MTAYLYLMQLISINQCVIVRNHTALLARTIKMTLRTCADLFAGFRFDSVHEGLERESCAVCIAW